MNPSSLFLLNTYADIDHITPMIWKASQKGIRSILFFSRFYDWSDDYRIQFLLTLPNVEICELFALRSPHLWGKVFRKLFYNRYFTRRFLKKNNIRSCVTEWYRPSGDLRGRFLQSANQLKIPCIAVPHGCNVHLNYNTKHSAPIENMKKIGRWSDISDMNVCDIFVADSLHNRQMFIDGGIESEKCQAWGTTRYCPEWVAQNTKICPDFIPKKNADGKIRIVFFLPHWRNNTNQPATLELLEKMAMLPFVYLVIKEHTRGNGEFPKSVRPKFESLDNVEIGESAHSASLTKWSDVVMSFGSSIAIDAVVSGKPMVYPAYLHGNTTIFDKYGACFKAGSEKDVLNFLQSQKNGANILPSKQEKDHFMKHVVYGGREPFDILEYYHSRIAGMELNR